MFHLGFHVDDTPYQAEPSPQVDDLWEALYKRKLSHSLQENTQTVTKY